MPFLLPAAATAVAAAAPAAAAAATTAAATAGITATLTSVATNILMNVAISAVMSALSPQVGAAGRTFEWTLDPDGPIPFAAGRIGVAGSAVYRETFGPDLMYYGIPSVISGAGPIDGFESFLADDESVTFDGTGKAISSQYAGELWYKTSLGSQPATAITSPSGLKSGAALPGWTSAHKLSGKASYMIVMGENSKGTAFPTGEIKPLVTVRGLKGWDPRKDSTYPGGSGACRLNDPSTWVYLANPILWALKWSLGLWEGPTGKGAPQVDYQVGGIGAKLSGIDVPAFVAAANVADANGWTVAAYPTTDDDKAQVLDAFLQAGGATYAQRAGKISCIQRAAPRTSIVTISGRDTAGPLEIDTAASRIDRINTIRPRYWSEAHRWQLTALPEVTASAYQTQDGGKRTRGIDYPYVTNPVQAAQLAALQIANTREGIAGVIPLKPHLQRIRPGDAFTITEEDFVLNGVKCLCLNTEYDPATGIVRVSFVSETDAKYPFALGQSPDVPVPPVLTPVDTRFVGGPLPGDWTVTPRPPGTGGTQLPGFDLTGLVSNATATAILVEYGPDPAGPWKQAYQGPPTVTNVPIDGVQPGATYYIAVSYQRGQNFSQREIYGPYTAPGLVAGDVLSTSPTIAGLNEQITNAFGDIFDLDGLLSTARDDIAEQAEAIAALDSGLDGVQSIVETHTVQIAGKASQSVVDAQILRIDGAVAINASQATALVDLENGKVSNTTFNTLSAEVAAGRDGQPSLLARIQQLNNVDLDLQANKASAASVTALAVRTGNTEADIIDLENAQAEETIARAQAIQQVSARQNINPNLLAGGSGEAGVAGWVGSGGLMVGSYPSVAPTYYYKVFPTGVAVDDFHVSPQVWVEGLAQITVQWKGYAYGSATVSEVWVAWYDSGGSYVGETPRYSLATGSAQTFTRPGGAIFASWVVHTVGPAPTAYADVVFHSIKIEGGPVATIYSNDSTTKGISAALTQQSLAIVDLENQQALAYFSQVASASGGLPAFVELLSSTLGGRAALAGPVVALLNTISGGDPLVALQAIGGEVFFPRPIYIDLGTKRLIVGPGNGWVMWFGGQDKTAATATRTNGGFSLGDDGQVYLGAAALAPASPFTASAPNVRVKNQIGGSGPITTTAVPITVSGATGSVTYTWSPVFGEIDGMTCSNTSSSAPTFSATIAGVGRVQTIWAWTASDSGTGTTRTGQTFVTIQRDA